MEPKDWLGLGSLVIALFALGGSGYSVALARARDRREIAAKLPTCEVGFDRLTKGYANDATLRIVNNGPTSLSPKWLRIASPKNWTLAQPVQVDNGSFTFDLSQVVDRLQFNKLRLLPGQVLQRDFAVRLVSYDDPMSEGAPDITFELAIGMGGESDQERRFTIHRTLKD